MIALETITLRPATAADVEQLADLIVQLYHAEAPGVLRGQPTGQTRLFRSVLEHELASGARGRYLAIDGAGQALGTASLRLAGDQSGGVLPPGILALSTRAVGLANTLRFLSNLARTALFADTPLRPGDAFIYSVVVQQPLRGRGVGRQMMEQLEDVARRQGTRSALLRVIVGNHGAKRLYERLGYRSVGRTPAWADRIAVASEVMRKDLRLDRG